ncbi:MAG: hypothetical protein EOO94_04230 [Pedobacter sp.]|nr:MAG: hypothetical protein EOO94_04230 [Pedobacter sp.]
MSGNINTLSKGGLSERSFNGTFSHIAIGVPITRRSGLSIGLLPYSELGYEFHNAGKIDTMNVDYNYSGEGGLSKAFIGYGYQIAKGFRLGLNLEYIFGNMQQLRSTEFINQPASINVRIQNRDNVYGLNFSYGAQYDVDLSDKVKLTIGYSGSARSGISSQETNVVTRFTRDIAGNENPAIDTAQFINNAASKFKLPVIHNVGFSISKYNNWLFGADVRIGQWADLEISGVNQGLQNTLGVSVGAQWTPDIAAVSGYFKRVDYRVGFQYDKSYVRLSNTDIKQTSATFGIGLPFSSISRFTFSKFNLATEIGQRGTLSNNLVKENFINFHLGFTLNDKWFSRFKFD